MKKPLFILALTLFAFFGAFGQRTADHILAFDTSIQTILTNPLNGNIIVKEANKISNYNPETNTVDWSIDEKEVAKKSGLNTASDLSNKLNGDDLSKLLTNEDTLEFIGDSPFIQGHINGHLVIINSLNGQVAYQSMGKKYTIALSQYLTETNQFLFLATEGKEVVCVLYDLEKATESWTTPLAQSESYLKSLKSLFSKGAMTREDQVVVGENSIYTTFNNKLYKLDKTSGQLLWTPDYELNRFYLSQNGNHVIIIKNTGGLLSSKQALDILQTTDGLSIWKNEIKTKFISYLEDWGDRILIAHNSGFNFYDYKTGNKQWKSDPKGSNIKRVITIDKNYLYVADDEMMLINAQGEKLWTKFIEISDDKEDPIYFLDKIDNNKVFYLTKTYANMVDYSTGKKVWKKNVSLDKKRPTLYAYDEKSKSFLVYNAEKLFKFDPHSTDSKLTPLAKLKVKNDKSMSGIEWFSWGVALTGENDVIGVGTDGQVKYHNEYKEPGEASRRLLKTGALIGSYYTGNRSGFQTSLANATVSVNYRNSQGEMVSQQGKLVSDAQAQSLNKKAGINQDISNKISATILTKVNQRHNALKQNPDYAFIFARGENKESNYLVKVRKSDGVEVDKIEVDTKKPIYEVDDVTGSIFYANGKELNVYLKK